MQKMLKRAPSELAAGASCYLERKTVLAGERFAPHWHDYFEFELILRGSGKHGYNRKTEPLQRGSAYLTAYYDLHELQAETDLELLKIQCTESALPSDLREYILLGGGRLCATLSEAEIARILALFEEASEEARNHAAFAKTVTEHAVATIFITLLRRCTKGTPSPLPPLLTNAMHTVQARFSENLTLTELAAAAFVTPNYLGGLFRKWTGYTFPAYLNTVRIRHACNLLSTTRLSVKEIAFATGYRSVEHFCYTFKKIMQFSPQAFRHDPHSSALIDKR